MAKLMLGNSRNVLDDKYRMRIPSKFRDGLGGDIPYIFPGRPGCLYIVSSEKGEAIVESFESDSLYSGDDKLDISTALFSYAGYVEEDAQGRFLLSKELRTYAGIEKELVIVGKGKYLEVWSSEAWDKRYGVLDPENVSKVLAKLKQQNVRG